MTHYKPLGQLICLFNLAGQVRYLHLLQTPPQAPPLTKEINHHLSTVSAKENTYFNTQWSPVPAASPSAPVSYIQSRR